MALPSLLPLAGAAIAPVLGKVIDGVAEGMSFLDVLRKQERIDKADSMPAAESKSLQRDFAKLADRLREKFASLGIELTTPIRLKQDGRDRVVVDGDHPDRVLIESILGNDDELANLFNELVDAASKEQNETAPGITGQFRFILEPSGAKIEFA